MFKFFTISLIGALAFATPQIAEAKELQIAKMAFRQLSPNFAIQP